MWVSFSCCPENDGFSKDCNGAGPKTEQDKQVVRGSSIDVPDETPRIHKSPADVWKSESDSQNKLKAGDPFGLRLNHVREAVQTGDDIRSEWMEFR